MTIYADTSWWIAFKCRRDIHHVSAIGLFDYDPEAQVQWTPWQRVEVFNAFRQAERAELIDRGEARQLIHLLEQEVRLGYWPHNEFSWTNAVRRAHDVSSAHALNLTVRGMDLFHVAVALEIRADEFLSFDNDQNALAEAAGLRLVRM